MPKPISDCRATERKHPWPVWSGHGCDSKYLAYMMYSPQMISQKAATGNATFRWFLMLSPDSFAYFDKVATGAAQRTVSFE